MNSTFYKKVFEAVKEIPEGKVATYGQIAVRIGHPNASRAVGSTLHKNTHPGIYPCHRVVNSKGSLSTNFAFGGVAIQRELLEREGVKVNKGGSVCLEKYVHQFE